MFCCFLIRFLGSEPIEILVPEAKSEILQLVTNYMVHHDGVEPPVIERPLRSKKMMDVCKDKWDATFIDHIGKNRQQLYDLILVAHYMSIKSLTHLSCAKVASLIKGIKTLEHVNNILAANQTANKTIESKKDQQNNS